MIQKHHTEVDGDGTVDIAELRTCLGEASTHLQDIFLAHGELRVR